MSENAKNGKLRGCGCGNAGHPAAGEQVSKIRLRGKDALRPWPPFGSDTWLLGIYAAVIVGRL
jgi:hypothetical protein